MCFPIFLTISDSTYLLIRENKTQIIRSTEQQDITQEAFLNEVKELLELITNAAMRGLALRNASESFTHKQSFQPIQKSFFVTTMRRKEKAQTFLRKGKQIQMKEKIKETKNKIFYTNWRFFPRNWPKSPTLQKTALESMLKLVEYIQTYASTQFPLFCTESSEAVQAIAQTVLCLQEKLKTTPLSALSPFPSTSSLINPLPVVPLHYGPLTLERNVRKCEPITNTPFFADLSEYYLKASQKIRNLSEKSPSEEDFFPILKKQIKEEKNYSSKLLKQVLSVQKQYQNQQTEFKERQNALQQKIEQIKSSVNITKQYSFSEKTLSQEASISSLSNEQNLQEKERTTEPAFKDTSSSISLFTTNVEDEIYDSDDSRPGTPSSLKEDALLTDAISLASVQPVIKIQQPPSKSETTSSSAQITKLQKPSTSLKRTLAPLTILVPIKKSRVSSIAPKPSVLNVLTTSFPNLPLIASSEQPSTSVEPASLNTDNNITPVALPFFCIEKECSPSTTVFNLMYTLGIDLPNIDNHLIACTIRSQILLMKQYLYEIISNPSVSFKETNHLLQISRLDISRKEALHLIWQGLKSTQHYFSSNHPNLFPNPKTSVNHDLRESINLIEAHIKPLPYFKFSNMLYNLEQKAITEKVISSVIWVDPGSMSPFYLGTFMIHKERNASSIPNYILHIYFKQSYKIAVLHKNIRAGLTTTLTYVNDWLKNGTPQNIFYETPIKKIHQKLNSNQCWQQILFHLTETFNYLTTYAPEVLHPRSQHPQIMTPLKQKFLQTLSSIKTHMQQISIPETSSAQIPLLPYLIAWYVKYQSSTNQTSTSNILQQKNQLISHTSLSMINVTKNFPCLSFQQLSSLYPPLFMLPLLRIEHTGRTSLSPIILTYQIHQSSRNSYICPAVFRLFKKGMLIIEMAPLEKYQWLDPINSFSITNIDKTTAFIRIWQGLRDTQHYLELHCPEMLNFSEKAETFKHLLDNFLKFITEKIKEAGGSVPVTFEPTSYFDQLIQDSKTQYIQKIKKRFGD